MAATIVSYFTNAQVPAQGLTPTVSAWKVNAPVSQILNNVNMEEVGGGFYRYVFSEVDGFSTEDQFVIRADGGLSLDPSERYSVGKLVTDVSSIVDSSVTQVASITANTVWNEPIVDHTLAGSFGELVQQTAHITPGEIATIADAVWDELLAPHTVAGSTGQTLALALDLLRTILKHNTNRTRIDPDTNTLTVYDDDNTTPIRVFTLKDRYGTPSITEVFERLPN